MTTILMAKSLTFPNSSFLDSAGSGFCGANMMSLFLENLDTSVEKSRHDNLLLLVCLVADYVVLLSVRRDLNVVKKCSILLKHQIYE